MTEHLNHDILYQLFSQLEPLDLHAMAKVDSYCFSISRSLGACQLDFSHFGDEHFIDNTNLMIDVIKQAIPTELDGTLIRHILIISHRFIPNNVFFYLQQRCPNVVSFDYDPAFLDTTSRLYPLRRHPFYTFNWRYSIQHLPACHYEQQRWWEDPVCRDRLLTLYIRENDFLLKYYQRDDDGNDDDGSTISSSSSSSSSSSNSSSSSRNSSIPDQPQIRLPTLPCLRTLTIHITGLVLDDHLLDNAIHRHCPQLTTLVLRETVLGLSFLYHQKSPTTYTQIDTLTLDHVAFQDVRMYTLLAQKYPNVQTLDLVLTNPNNNNNNSYDSDSLLYTGRPTEHIFDMITSFQKLAKVIVHLIGFGTAPDSAVDPWFQAKMQAHYSQDVKRHIEYRVTFGFEQKKPRKMNTVLKTLTRFLCLEK